MAIKFVAYWIDSYGKIIPLSSDRHINEIWENPEKFGYTEKELKAVFKKHKEPRGAEGNAREEIMHDLIKKGWGRVRYISRDDSYTVQIWALNSKQKDNLYDWAVLVAKEETDKKTIKHTEVVIMELKPGGDVIRGSIGDIISFKLFQESKRMRKKTKALTFIEDYIARHKKV